MKVQGKTVVVTGAGAGIGKALVGELLLRGANVAAVDYNETALGSLKNQFADTGARLSVHTADISNRTAVQDLPKAVIDAHGNVDGIINNAGVIQPFVKINDLSYEDAERVVNINFYGTLAMVKSFLPHLLVRPEGHITNIASMGGFLPVPGQGIYGASKAAVKLMSESLYAELLETSVGVSTVFPGATETDIAKNSNATVDGNAKNAKSVKMLSPTKAAEIIVNGMENNKPLICTGSDSTFMNRIYRLNPVFATKFIAKQMRSLLKG